MKPSDQAIATAFREYHGGPAFEAATRRIENRAAEIQRDLDAQPSECADLRAENASLRAQLAEQERRAERWKWKYGNRRSVIARWHDQAVALGYDGVDDLLAATPERAQAAPSVPEFDTSDVEAVRRLFHRGPHGEDTLVDHTILDVLRAADTHRAQRAEHDAEMLPARASCATVMTKPPNAAFSGSGTTK